MFNFALVSLHMKKLSENILRYFLPFFISFTGILPVTLLHAQVPSISGTVNSYYKVETVFNNNKANIDSVLVDNVTDLHKGDTVMLVQMKGAEVEPSNGNLFSYFDLNYVGRYEILLINQVDVPNRIIIFTSSLSFYNESSVDVSYNAADIVQLVKVKSYRKVKVDGTLTCPSWNGETGGVIALIAGDSLWLNANIDASGKGFRGGGNDVLYSYGCTSDTIFQKKNYPESADTAGWKGEGITAYDTSLAKGYGNLGMNPGGADGFNAGGGGGSNAGIGGSGGSEACGSPFVGGNGGRMMASYYGMDNHLKRVYMGSGGGGGTHSAGYTSSKGGNGGGIVLIMTGTLVGNGKTIRANGDSATTSTGGAGGGGGGGVVLMDVTSYNGSLTAEAKGGKGGSTSGSLKAGPGGGGGGGVVWYVNPTSGTFTPNVTYGDKGTMFGGGSNAAVQGGTGVIKSDLIVQTRGWLFNVMPLDDTICASTFPKRIMPSYPKGGYGPGSYHYQWYKSKFKTGPYSLIAGLWDSVFYQPPILDSTTFFKRMILSLNPGYDTIRDTSLIYTIKVYPAIGNNMISASDTFCYGQDPGLLKGIYPNGGNGIYSIHWDRSTSSTFNPITPDVGTDTVFDPPSLTETTWFRRRVVSGVCRDTSNILRLTVLPLISNNIIYTNDTLICYNQAPPLKAALPAGGDGSYMYRWEVKSDSSGGVFHKAPGSAGLQNYQNPLLTDTLYVRRMVWSGADTVCRSISSTIAIKVAALISHNIIQSDQILCEADTADQLKGTYPAGGDVGNYQYRWEKSINLTAWTLVQENAVSSDTIYFPGIMTDTTWYRRVIFSGLAATCKDTSNAIKISVQPKIQGNNIWIQSTNDQDTVQCYGTLLTTLKGTDKPTLSGGDGSVYRFVWKRHSVAWDSISPSCDLSYLQPLQQSLSFIRNVYSGKCFSGSDTILVTVLPPVSSNLLIASDTICTSTSPGFLSAATPAGGDNTYTYHWEKDTGSGWNTISGAAGLNLDPGALTVNTSFRRIVFSGPYDCCKDTSFASNQSLYPLPVADLSFTNPFTTGICENTQVLLTFSASVGTAPFNLYYSRGDSSFSANITSMSSQLVNIPHPATGVDVYTFIYKSDSLRDSHGCMAENLTGVDSVTVYKKPDITLLQDTSKVCGKLTTLEADQDVGTGMWKVDNVLPGAALSQINIASPADKNSSLTSTSSDTAEWIHMRWVVDNRGCSDSACRWYVLYRIPPHQVLNADTTLFYEFSFDLTAEPIKGPTETGLWTFTKKSDEAPDLDISDPENSSTTVSLPREHFGDYTVLWTVLNRICPYQTDSVLVNFKNIHGYDGFSPNGDGINDVFWIEGIENIDAFDLTIMNRWGEIVYRYTKTQGDSKVWTGWDGKHYKTGEELPDGIYYYILKANGKYYKKNGDTGHYLLLKR